MIVCQMLTWERSRYSKSDGYWAVIQCKHGENDAGLAAVLLRHVPIEILKNTFGFLEFISSGMFQKDGRKRLFMIFATKGSACFPFSTYCYCKVVHFFLHV